MRFNYSILSNQANQWLIAFYGYGQVAEVYRPLALSLEREYNVLVIELPYQSLDAPIEKQEFVSFVKSLMNKNGFNQFVGLSYSMGSRFNLVLAECIPESISKLILIAPDGIRIRFWNRLSTQTSVGSYLFKVLAHHPTFYEKISNFFYKMKLITKSMYAFSKWHMRDQQNRLRVYNAWMNMKNIIPDLDQINSNTKRHQFQIIAYFGKYDEVINSGCMKKLAMKIPSAQITVLDKGHSLLDEEMFEEVKKCLKR